jgi:multiple sugar transport system permease protein
MATPAIRSGLGIRGRRLLLHAAVYSLLILAIIVMCFPLAWMLTISVRPNVEVMTIPPDWIPQVFTLEAYAKIFQSDRYLRVFLNTCFVAVVVTVLSLLLGSMAAYALARFRFIGHRTVMMFLITTQMFPLVLLCIPYFRIFITLGLYDTLLSLIVVYLTFTLPFCILMLRSYFLNIPKDIEEAAMVDGCSRLGAILRILVPI